MLDTLQGMEEGASAVWQQPMFADGRHESISDLEDADYMTADEAPTSGQRSRTPCRTDAPSRRHQDHRSSTMSMQTTHVVGCNLDNISVVVPLRSALDLKRPLKVITAKVVETTAPAKAYESQIVYPEEGECPNRRVSTGATLGKKRKSRDGNEFEDAGRESSLVSIHSVTDYAVLASELKAQKRKVEKSADTGGVRKGVSVSLSMFSVRAEHTSKKGTAKETEESLGKERSEQMDRDERRARKERRKARRERKEKEVKAAERMMKKVTELKKKKGKLVT